MARDPAASPLSQGAVRRALRMGVMSQGVVGSYVGYLVQRAFLGEDRRKEKLKAAHTKAAQHVRNELQLLRGPMMKVGQALSLQTDLLPEEILKELSQLQMSAPGMHPSLVRVQFKGSLGREPEEVFRSFEPEPFAAASLGQVHHAVTHRGERVAVKIQYPGIRQAVENDFKTLRAVSTPMQAFGHLPPGALEEIEHGVLAETDYGREAANIEYFRKNLASLDFVAVPEVYKEYSSDKVLTMSLLPGKHLGEFLAARPSQAVRDRVGAHLLELFTFQMVKMGALHADPHWGNYLFSEDGTIGLVDFGCVKYLNPAFMAAMRVMYFGDARSEKYQAQLSDWYRQVKGAKLSPATRRAFTEFADRFYHTVYPPAMEDQNRPVDFGDARLLKEFRNGAARVVASKGILPEYIFLGRAEEGLYSTLHRLRARVKTSAILRKHLL
jgi:predicted unusual protein kinase regulating ubiquinone biosynthesis (AarF/ABC1/UbiB family)